MVLYPCLDITCGNTLVILILIIWSECSKSSPLWCYRFFFSLEINKQSLGKYFNIRQIPCSLSKISPKFSIYWWSLPGIVFSIVVADCCFSNSSLPLSQCQHPTVNKNHWLTDLFFYLRVFSYLSLVWAYRYVFFAMVYNSLLYLFGTQIVQVRLLVVDSISLSCFMVLSFWQNKLSEVYLSSI